MPRSASFGAQRGRPRTEWGRWRRVRALQRLEQAHHPAVPRLIKPVLADSDPMIAAAAIRTLGDIGDEWAIDLLLDALRRGHSQRSRIAAELERLAPAPGPQAPPAAPRLGTPASVSGVRRCFDRIRSSGDDDSHPAHVGLRPQRACCGRRDARNSERSCGRHRSYRATRRQRVVRPCARCASRGTCGRSRRCADHRSTPRATSAGGCVPPPRTRFVGWAPTPFRRCCRSWLTTTPSRGTERRRCCRTSVSSTSSPLDNPRSPLLERIYEAGGERYRLAAEERAARPLSRIEDVRAA